MRCILKEAERPAAFIETEHETRLLAAREFLPVCASPEFYSLSPQNTLVIAFDGMWFLKNEPANFFVCPPTGTNLPVTPVIGDAVIFRCKPVQRFSSETFDYELQDCTEADLKYIESLLRSDTQHKLRKRYLNDCRGVALYYSTITHAARSMMAKLERWKEVHPKEPKETPIGHAAKILPRQLPQEREEEEIRRRPFRPNQFNKFCVKMGFQCTFPYTNTVLIKQKHSMWKITHEECLVTKLEYASVSSNFTSLSNQEISYRNQNILNPDIYKLVRFISLSSET